MKRCIEAWFVLPKALDLWRLKLHSPENHVTASVSGSIEANHSAVSFTLYYIIMHFHCFLFILIYILRSNELCPWNNSLRTEAELTLTDHRFNSLVYVWFIWIILVAVHGQKWMTLILAIILYNTLKQRISSITRCETSSCNESQHFGRCYSSSIQREREHTGEK